MIRGAETIAHYRRREEGLDGPKPQFGDLDGERETVPPVQEARVLMQEVLQRRYAEEGAPEPGELRPWVR